MEFLRGRVRDKIVMSKLPRGSLVWLIVGVVILVAAGALFHPARRPGSASGGSSGGKSASPQRTDLSKIVSRAKRHPGTIRRVVFSPGDQDVKTTLTSGRELDAYYPSAGAQVRLQALLEKQGVDFASEAPPSGGGGGGGWVARVLGWVVPVLLIGGLWFFLVRRSAGGQMNDVLGVLRHRAKRVSATVPESTYADVAGAEEAVQELCEIRDFLAEPRRFRALGARIPKGVLLYGPPGTGKTLLARATAGEARVPFFTISGSDFVEMFVGVGASRVRKLFEEAKQEGRAIVFIDELDAVGRHRGAGLGGGHDEREQTLNQLLVEMDGFAPNENVVVMAATNRPDILDPALMRPGRFDRQVLVDRPDRRGRRQILEVHARGKPLAGGVDLDRLAAATPGFTGADLANLLNEAALLAGRERKSCIEQPDLDEATLRVVAGPEKRSRTMTEHERTVTAYHEMGHALAAWYLEHTERPQKVSIIGRGRALGFTLSLPPEDQLLTVRSQLMDQLAMTLGGRAAEELAFGEVSTGATNDLERATEIATQMVTRYGMSDALGPRVVTPPGDGHQPFLGRELGRTPDHSEELARKIDREVRRIIDEAYGRVLRLLHEHLLELHSIAHVLREDETLELRDLERLLAEHAPSTNGRVPPA